MDNDEEIARLQKRRESILTVLFAIVGSLGIFIFLMVVTWGLFAYVLLVLVGIAGFGILNYWLWGRGMMRDTAGEREEEELRANMERPLSELSETEQPRHL
jgi:nicotinamide riboside transporter PnuC